MIDVFYSLVIGIVVSRELGRSRSVLSKTSHRNYDPENHRSEKNINESR